MTIEQLKVLITAETSGLRKEIKKVESHLTGLDKTADKATKSINNSFKNIFKGISVTAAVAGLVKLGKTAINTASDLEEVQNVVDVSFGASAKEIDKFAANALKQFGLSELSAKKMASTFMSMSNGMGIGANEGKAMSLALTGLAGDMASFYNVSADIAETALHSVFTGETESLKRFGIVLTEANLQQFAFSKGITKQVSAMTQAEKVGLRYSYVMSVTNKAQGDFVRTGGNWANQVRVLKEQWSQLLGILGKGLIQVLKPVVQVLNEMLGSLIAVANAMARAFGGKGIESSTGSVASSVGNIANGAEDAAGGFDNATSSAKKLSKTLAGFDELNILSSTSGDSGASGGGGNVSVEGTGSIVDTEMENPATKLSSYLQECKTIINKWTSTIPKLEINFDKEKAMTNLENIGLNITNTIAGWGSFAISLAIDIANDADLGNLANSVLNLWDKASKLASTITDALVPALQTFYKSSGLQKLVQWIGEKLADGIDGAAGKLDEWSQWFSDNKENINTFADNLGKAVQPLSEIVIQIGNVAWTVFATTLGIINDAVKGIATALVNMDSTGITTLVYSILGISGVLEIANGAAKLFGVSLGQILLHPVTAFEAFKIYLSDVAIPGILSAISGLVAKIGGFLTGLKTVIITIGKAIAGFVMAHPVIAAIVVLVGVIAAFGDEIQGVLKKFNDWLTGIFTKDWTETFGPVLGGLLNGFFTNVKAIWDGVYQIFNGLIDFIRGVFTGDWERAWEGVKSIFKGVWDTLVAVVKFPINSIINLINGLINAVVTGVNTVIKNINKLSWDVPDWVPGIGGTKFGFNFKTLTAPQIPLLANGGVIKQPTVAMMGEYPGASSNPEIAAPQSVLQQVIANSNNNVVDALIQQTKQLLVALEGMNMSVSIGDEVIAQSAQRGNASYRRRTGKPLFV